MQTPADALRQAVEESGGAVPVSVRWLRRRLARPVAHRRGLRRFSLAGYLPLGESERRAIEDWLASAGIQAFPPISSVSAGDDVVLYVPIREAHREAAGGKRRRYARPLRAVWRFVLRPTWGTMVAVATIGGVVGLWLMVRPDRPVKLDGDLNIVVTRFWTVAEGAALSRDVEASIVRHIRRALSRSVPELDFQIAVPAGAAGPLSRDPSRATRDAAKVAAGMRAGIVLYGGLRFTGAETVATPRFYVASSTLRGAEELTDGYALGPPIRIRGDATANFASRADLRTQIGARTGALALVLIGLAYDRAGRWGRAIGFYERALGEIRWSRSGRILLLLLIGNAAGELGQHARAARAYAEALRLEPEYARAKYGLAELALHRASGECSPATTDAHALRRVSRAFSGVSRARVQPRLRRPRQTLEAKVVFGRARADFCLSQAGFDMRWEAAARGFHAVISRHRRNVADIQDEASESLAYLGFIELPARGAGDRRAAYRRAARRFSLAIKWSPRPDRQAHFYSMLGFTREQLGDTVAAATAYRRAALRAPTTRERRRNMDRAAVLERGAR